MPQPGRMGLASVFTHAGKVSLVSPSPVETSAEIFFMSLAVCNAHLFAGHCGFPFPVALRSLCPLLLHLHQRRAVPAAAIVP